MRASLTSKPFASNLRVIYAAARVIITSSSPCSRRPRNIAISAAQRQIKSWNPEQSMYQTVYHRPGSLKEAAEIFRLSQDASYLSGGHTLIPTMKNRLAAPTDLIDVRRIPELKGIRIEDGRVIIGAAQTHFEVA